MAQGSNNSKLSASELGEAALATIEELTGHEPEAVVGLEWDGEHWLVTVEVLELARIPNTTDVIGSYVVQLDPEGTLRGFRREGRHQRGQADER
jgi:Gas vesicle synthesis protein GvpO